VLENESIRVALDAAAGIASIEDRRTGKTTRIDGKGFRLEVTDGTISGSLATLTPSECALRRSSLEGARAEYQFEKDRFRIRVVYELGPQDAFATKRIHLQYSGPGKFSVRRCEMFDWEPTPKPQAAIPYYGMLTKSFEGGEDLESDPLPSSTSTAFFMRAEDDGIFSCLTTDFALMREEKETGRCQLIYWPGRIHDGGREFASEYGIAGVYQRKGYFHEPTCSMKQLPRGTANNNIDIRLDRGEIEAVQAAVQKFIRPGVYYTAVNAWGLSVPFLILDAEGADALKAAIDTMGSVPGIDGLHFIHGLGGLAERFREQGLATAPDPNPYVKEVYEYAREKGKSLSIFVGISNNHPIMRYEKEMLLADRDLLTLDEEGERNPRNIAISDTYIHFVEETVAALAEKYTIGGFTYDFLRLLPDYDSAHGYLPGRASLQPQYANIIEANRRLRKRFPHMMLRGQIGWNHLGPWLSENMSLCHNSGDHAPDNMRNFLDFHIDHQYANNIRLTNWFSNNCRMFPRHKMNSNSLHNGGAFRAWDYGAFQYCVLSQMATSQVFGMFHNLPDAENGEKWRKQDVEFFEKWLKWHREHSEYYLRETELFGEPRPDGVDGYAYGNGADSIVFLCNPTYETHTTAVPIGPEIFLPEGRDYVVRELHPEERNRTGPSSGVFAHGSLFIVSVPPQTVTVFEVKPDAPGEWLLTGIGGRLRETPEGVEIEEPLGPTGSTRLVGIRTPAGHREDTTVRIGGERLPVRRDGRLLLGRVRFKGERIDREIPDREATRDGNKVKLQARFQVPHEARAVLESQNTPIALRHRRIQTQGGMAGLGSFHHLYPHRPFRPEPGRDDREPDGVVRPPAEGRRAAERRAGGGGFELSGARSSGALGGVLHRRVRRRDLRRGEYPGTRTSGDDPGPLPRTFSAQPDAPDDA